MANDQRKESAADLLGDWRAAERDTVAAKAARRVASLAHTAAAAAEEAANETNEAARLAQEAANRAQAAAERARHAAQAAMEAAQLAAVTGEGDEVRAGQALADAEAAETAARERYHDAEQQGFPKKAG